MTTTFTELGIKTELVAALAKKSITEPTPIQIAAIPQLLEKKNAYLLAETGTGKTLAYLLPLFSRIDTKLPNAQVIIVAPTHELAIQIQRQCTELSQDSGLPVRVILLIGGTPIDRQIEKLKKKPHVIVGSLGRIRELIEARKIKPHLVHTLVVDEADRLLASESITDLEIILKASPRDMSLLFVSATELSGTASAVAALTTNAVTIKTADVPVNPDIEHLFLVSPSRDKAENVRKLIYALQAKRTIIFTHTSQEAELITRKLAYHKMSVIDIHGTMHKEDRKIAMDRVRSGKVDVLVASDVAARGLDIKGITHVINYDMPSDSGAYLHRVGRTGRAGESGAAVSLIADDQRYLIRRYMKDLGVIMSEVYMRNGEIHVEKVHNKSKAQESAENI